MENVWHYTQHHWFQMTVDGIAILNVLAAGARVMGWTQISDFCGKLELAITAMVQTALSRGQNTTTQTTVTPPPTKVS
jgi:hypothetical protein